MPGVYGVIHAATEHINVEKGRVQAGGGDVTKQMETMSYA
jgi:hypothetical protein